MLRLLVTEMIYRITCSWSNYPWQPLSLYKEEQQRGTEQGTLLLLQGSLCEGSPRLFWASSQLQQPHHSSHLPALICCSSNPHSGFTIWCKQRSSSASSLSPSGSVHDNKLSRCTTALGLNADWHWMTCNQLMLLINLPNPPAGVIDWHLFVTPDKPCLGMIWESVNSHSQNCSRHCKNN